MDDAIVLARLVRALVENTPEDTYKAVPADVLAVLNEAYSYAAKVLEAANAS